jgi:hypothetical protein
MTTSPTLPPVTQPVSPEPSRAGSAYASDPAARSTAPQAGSDAGLPAVPGPAPALGPASASQTGNPIGPAAPQLSAATAAIPGLPPIFLAVPDIGRAAADPLSGAHFPRLLTSAIAGASPLPLQEVVPEVAAEEGPEPSAASESGSFATVVPQMGDLTFGAVALDLAAIEGAVDAFFTRLEGLTDRVAATGAPKLFPWLLAAILAAGAWELSRRHSALWPRGTPPGGDGPSWAPFPVLTVLAPEDAP